MEIFVDIETLATNDPDIMRDISAGITAPKSMSKADTIAKWEAEEKPRLIEEAISKTALDGTFGRVCCIAYALGDGKVDSIIDRDEKKVLTAFFSECSKHSVNKSKVATERSSMLTVVGHAITAFDMRFMWQRAIINGIKPALCLPWDSKPWGEHVKDTMLMWNPDRDKKTSLHTLCLALGVESPKDKNGITGADVARLWREKQFTKISGYACDDVDSMRQCYRKMTI